MLHLVSYYYRGVAKELVNFNNNGYFLQLFGCFLQKCKMQEKIWYYTTKDEERRHGNKQSGNVK